MFNSYDMSTLGTYLKNLRKNLNLTQQEVSKKGKINIETLRRIENGKVMPKYETVETLSIVYRIDLLSAFSFLRNSSELFELYKELDKAIISYNVKIISKLEDKLNDYLKHKEDMKLVNVEEIEQLRLFVAGIKCYYQKDYEECYDTLIGAILITNPHFSIENISLNKLNMIESRILLLLSLCMTAQYKHEDANDIMLLNLRLIIGSEEFSTLNIQLVIKLFFNISYNFYNLQDRINSIKYSNKGIKFCKEHNSMYCLHLLYYRRGIAKFKIGNNGYKKDLRTCYELLSIQSKNDIIKEFKTITKNKHGID